MLSQKLCGLLAAVIMVVACWAGTATAECQPEPSCIGKEPGDKVADPFSCTCYYICQENEIPNHVPKCCSDYFYFDPDLDECNLLPKCPYDCLRMGCEATCAYVQSDTYISNPTNCSQYYKCLPGEVIGPRECTNAEPYFDQIEQKCVSDRTACCDPCEPICNRQWYSIPDPKDCTMFYFCADTLGPPSSHEACTFGTVFVPGLDCVPDDEYECIELCPDESKSTTTTSPITTTSPLTTTSPASCINSAGLCTVRGSCSKCSDCCLEYWYCYGAGWVPQLNTCPEHYVFNPDPSYPYCVETSNCPCSINSCPMF